MLRCEHTDVEVTHFLTKWLYKMKKIINKETILTQVEVDISWPMLYSVCNSFNTQTLDNYLQICWEIISPNGICMHPLKTLLHICSAQIINRFIYKIERNLTERPNKETKRLIMFTMARLTSCTTLDEMNSFTSLCILCLSRVKYLEIEQYCELQNAVYNFDENYEFEMEYLSEIDEELPNEMGDSITYRKKSPLESILILQWNLAKRGMKYQIRFSPLKSTSLSGQSMLTTKRGVFLQLKWNIKLYFFDFGSW